MTKHEVWKDIAGYDGVYQISSYGRVRTHDRYVKHGTKIRFMKGRLLNPVNCHGYRKVTLCKNGVHKSCSVHRLVADAFVQNPNNYPIVDHINAIRDDNRAENLDWVTQKENVRRSEAMGLRKVNIVNAINVSAKKNSKPVVRDDGKRYYSLSDAARDIGSCAINVSRVCNGIRKTVCGYSFEWEEK